MKTQSLCPECLKIIDAELLEKDGKIVMKKKCSAHGEFSDTYWSNASLYKKFQKFSKKGNGLKNPMTEIKNGCPRDCGLCPNHETTTILANLDVTNRCNQKCPICFANAAQAGYVYEPTLDEIRKMLLVLRNEKPIATPAIQFSGGEPTVRKDFIEIVKMAKELGFSQIQMASNGVTLARQENLAEKLKEAGLNTVYLQFDGLKEQNYIDIRGYNALPNKIKAIEHCNKANLDSVTLVPTIVRGFNEDQIGPIINFALKNIKCVRGVNFQPVSFVGRIDEHELQKKRITVSDVIEDIEKQTNGALNKNDFYPVPFVLAISHFIEAWRGEPIIEFTIHPHCGAATYVFFENNKIIPITRFLNVEKFMDMIEKMANELKRSKSKNLTKVKLLGKLAQELPKIIDNKQAPKNLNMTKLFINVLREGTVKTLADFHRDALFIGIMHFQDAYNFDLERIKKCGIHYVIPDGRVIPFCSYNTIHRETIEKKFAKK